MAKRGFFAELHYQAQQAEKRNRQQQAAAVRAHNAAVREYERAERAAERARLAADHANAADRKAAEKEAKRLHVEAQEAEVEAMNAQLTATYDDIDRLLEATLEVDDFVDLETLKSTAQHPESAMSWMSVLTDVKNRGVTDVFFVVCDGLKGLPDSVNAIWPQAEVQSCLST